MNRDKLGGRGTTGGDWKHYDLHWKAVTTSRVLQARQAKYVIFDCSGFGPKNHLSGSALKLFSPREKLSLISLSNTRQNAKPWDQGLPPP